MLIPLQQCQLAVETASINISGSQDGGIEIPGWDRPQGRESQRQGPYGKAHARATRGSRQDGRRQMGAEDIKSRLAGGAAMKPGKLTLDKRLKMATAAKKATARPAVPVVAAKKSKAQPRYRRKPKP